MKEFVKSLPPQVMARALSVGEKGKNWLEGLDQLIACLETQWNIKAGKPLTGGTHSYAAYADGPQGEQYVLKIDMPGGAGHGELSDSLRVLEAARGRGYARLFAVDLEKRACLLERLGRPLSACGYSPYRQMEIICAALQEAWSIPVDGFPKKAAREQTAWFRGYIRDSWLELGKPCPASVIDRAYQYLESREGDQDPDSWVLVHGDAHNGNLLEDPSCPGAFKFVDPDGFVYEKGADLGVLMREWRDQYQKNPEEEWVRRCEFLSRQTGVIPRPIWEWGLIQCVSTGLLCQQTGQGNLAQELLKIAERCPCL